MKTTITKAATPGFQPFNLTLHIENPQQAAYLRYLAFRGLSKDEIAESICCTQAGLTADHMAEFRDAVAAAIPPTIYRTAGETK